ncbi:hypothetical protein PG999_000329 [Apiospora kogelbergensis]|uniref:Major facilitator superfamily (MFS) profile domain-containing protein n=1 Tax=Apiospora kogelbergensis TaxID=1337665 RepID=A0AAW0RBL5_9PEZI
MDMAHHPSESIPLTRISIESDASVVSPFLSPRTSLGADSNGFAKSESPPLPRRQIILLCYARLMEIIGLYSVFPYIAQMIQHIQQMPESDVGFYSGLVESLFSVVEMAALPAWNKLSERIGRRPALVWSIAGMAVFTALFGTATSVAQLILYRCLAGVFSGSGLIIRTMIQEQTTADTQAVAFSWFAIADNIGTCVGPLIGGIFADPAKMYPSVFGGIQFFRAYPYALPGIVVGVINMTGAVTSAFFLEETVENSARGKTGDHRRGRRGPTETQPDTTQRIGGFWQVLREPGVPIALLIYTHVMLVMDSFAALLPVALFTSVRLGGFGLTPAQISLYMTALAASQSLWFLVAFPRLDRRFGTRNVLYACAIAFPIYFAGYILTGSLLRSDHPAGFWASGILLTLIGPAAFMSFTAVQLVINNVSSDARLLGTITTLAMVLHSGTRTVSPGATSAIYAVGVRNSILGGYFGWVVLIPLSSCLYVFLRWLPLDA